MTTDDDGDLSERSVHVRGHRTRFAAGFETLNIRQDGGVLFAEIAAPPMNLLGPELGL
jgi:hypothetical protein